MPKKTPDPRLRAMACELMGDLEILSRRFFAGQKTSDLSRSETALLRLLADRGVMTMSEISAELTLALSSTTGVVDTLVGKGLVERSRPEADRRTVVVGLTRDGRKIHGHFIADRANLGRAMLEPLSPSERQQLLALFRKIREAR